MIRTLVIRRGWWRVTFSIDDKDRMVYEQIQEGVLI